MLRSVIKLVYGEEREFVGHIEMNFLGEHKHVKIRVKPIEVQRIKFALITFVDETSEILYRRELEAGYKRQKELFWDTVKALATAVDAKDAYTKGHSLRVSKYSKMLAYELGFSGDKLELIEIAGLLHDIGKIGIRDTILNKGSELSLEEFEEMKKHPEIGAKIVGNIKELSPIVPAILYHHERVDGSGYPSGLKGEEIPIEARIIAVADAYDAMTTDRPYKKAIAYSVAIKEIERYKGIYFCPKVIKALKKSLDTFERENLKDIVNGKVV
jgi:putative nucleotidyltransferase with HDIG domain